MEHESTHGTSHQVNPVVTVQPEKMFEEMRGMVREIEGTVSSI